MSEKKDNIKNGQNISLEDGNITVINSGITLAEPEKKEEMPQVIPAETEEVSPAENPLNVDINPSPVPVAPVELPNDLPSVMSPEINFGAGSNSSFAADEPIYPGFENQMPKNEPQTFGYDNFSNNENSFDAGQEISKNNVTSDFLSSGVYKSTSDVDSARRSFLRDVEKAYDQNISEPTKAVVSLLNDFKEWGNKVTSQGLNKRLFEAFEALIKRYDGLKVASYGGDNNFNNVTDFNQFGSSYNDEDNNNYGGMVA